jgi:glycosyltransferase involved in cell wall biosynthesis
MNVVFANATRTWAGVKTWMVELASFLAGRGHCVDIVCRRGNAMKATCDQRRIACQEIDFGPDFSPRAIALFAHLFRARQADVVVTNISKDIRTAGITARMLGVAHVNRLGDAGDVNLSMRTRLSYDWLVDRVLVASRDLLAHFQSFPFLADKLRRFPNAVLPPPWVEKDDGPTRFAILARLSRRKQVDEILKVFARLRHLAWELHIAGSGPERSALATLAATLGLGERVHFLCDEAAPSTRVDPHAFLRDKHVGILYSRQEAFGWAILEYMASSCAVIASAVAGPAEILADGAAGLLVDPTNPATLETAVRQVIASPERRSTLARDGYARVCREYHQDTVFPAVEAELEATIAERRRARSGRAH